MSIAEIIDFPTPDLDGISITEEMAARQFATIYRDQLLYDHTIGKWYEFDGNIWRVQETEGAFHLAREMLVRLSVRAKNRATMQSLKFCRAVEVFSQRDPVFAVTSAVWNRDLFLLGTPSGTVNLKTGLLTTANRASRITKCTAIEPDDYEECPIWINFLIEATNNDHGLIRFLQQICGYALTGDISEQALFFLSGRGGNGKGVFLSVVQNILHDYSVVATMEAFEQQKNNVHTTDVAMMQGARLVSASETNPNAAWNEKRIKLLTGGDKITARFMGKNNVTFTPQFTLLVIGNDKPSLSSVDDAMRRRFNIIPFNFKPTKQDTRLPDKLQTEWAAILRWMINGCLDWQKNGFVKPEVVLKATAKYFDDQDMMGEWLRTYCEVDLNNRYLFERSTPLFTSWATFAKRNGVDAGNFKTFKPNMEKLGLESDRAPEGSVFRYVRLRGNAHVEDEDNPFPIR